MSALIPGNATTLYSLQVNSSVFGSIDFIGDIDWRRVSLNTGFGYQIFIEGWSSGMGTLLDPLLAIYGSDGAYLASNDNYSIWSWDSYYYAIPTRAGAFYVSAQEARNSSSGTYLLTLWADQLASDATGATIAPNAQVTDRIGWRDDVSDWYAITLTAGVNYQIDLVGSGRDGASLALSDPLLVLRGAGGSLLTSDNNSGVGDESRIFYTAPTTGVYYIDVQEWGNDGYGVYSLIVNASPVRGALGLASAVSGALSFSGDTDLYSMSLASGVSYGFFVNGGTLANPFLEILNQLGHVQLTDDDSGLGLNSLLSFSPGSSGTYFLAARASGNDQTGSYTARAWVLPTLSIADSIVNEGDAGVTSLTFTISLSAPSPVDVRFTIGTRGSTASNASGDYQGISATSLTIPAGQTQAVFPIAVNGDEVFEPNEGMRVLISAPFMATVAQGEARGWIIDDDAPYALPSDEFMRYQWHLYPGTGANVFPVWSSWTGAGVKVGVFDQGIDPRHPDLDGNLLVSLGRSALNLTAGGSPVYTDDNHGTAVAGVIAAELNGALMVGVAPAASLVSIYSPLSGEILALEIVSAYRYALSLDVLNDSWGYGNYSNRGSNFSWAFLDNFRTPAFSASGLALKDLADLGRGGLGVIVVQSAGNSFSYGDDTNLHNFQNSRYIVTVAATDYSGGVTSYSSPGASILLSAPGGSDADFLGNIFTTDRVGASGYSTEDYVGQIGTSFSAPVVSGVVALMLQANPGLGYRDVQQILALTARVTAPEANDWRYNGGSAWNGGGLHYDAADHNLGFGLVDALAAVRLAESWSTPALTSANDLEVSATRSVNQVIPDGGSSLRQSIMVTTPIEVERAEVTISITHPFIGNLSISLTSPAGTESWLMWRPGQGALSAFGQAQANINFTFNTVLSMGESGIGNWALSVFDMALGNVGRLNSWTLNLVGKAESADDVYVYTNEFSEAVLAQSNRATLSDSSGIDTLNAAAVTGPVSINLIGGGVSTINGRSLTISVGSMIENAYGGDGSDLIRGNSASNVLMGMRGADTLYGGDGDDRLVGGAGSDLFDWEVATRGGADTMEGGLGDDTYFVDSADQVVELQGEGIDTVWSVGSLSLLTIPDVENLFLFGTAGVVATGNALANVLRGNDLANALSGLSGNDTIDGGVGDDSIDGGGGDDSLTGGAGSDVFDWAVDGRGGSDTMVGGAGDDTYVLDSLFDVVMEVSQEGIDTVFVGFGYSLIGTELEHLRTFIGHATSLSFIGNSHANRLVTGSGDDTLTGGGGNDTLTGVGGNDLLNGGDGIDTAVFSGPRKNYTITYSIASNSLSVNSTSEGVDSLSSIESLLFSDSSYSAGVFQTPSAPTFTRVSPLSGGVEDSSYVVTWSSLIAAGDEMDAQGDPISFRVVAVTNGTLSKAGVAVIPGITTLADGEQLVWTPAPNASGAVAAFKVRAVDEVLTSSSDVQVSIAVTPVNDAPIAAASSKAATEDTPFSGSVNATDIEGSPLTFVAVTQPAHGTLALDSNGTYIYTPAANYNGADSFTFRANDGASDSTVAMVSIAVNAVNDAPVATNASASLNEDTILSASLPLATDVEGDTLTYARSTTPAHGTVTVNANGSYTYQPAADYFGADSFGYSVSDGQGAGNTYTVSITVNGVADTLNGTAGPDVLTDPTGGPSVINGLDGSDTITGGSGDDTLNGGAGLDVALYGSARAANSFLRLGNGDVQISGPEGVDTLHEVERAVFVPETVGLRPLALGFDLDGTGGKAYRLYQAAFDRVPDEGGVGFWMYYIDRGFSLIDAAANFMGSAEFKGLYGDNPSNEQFMNLLYANVMNRAPDDGYYFWLDALYGRGQFEGTVSSRPFVLQRFSESAENQANVIGVITDGFRYEVFTPPV